MRAAFKRLSAAAAALTVLAVSAALPALASGEEPEEGGPGEAAVEESAGENGGGGTGTVLGLSAGTAVLLGAGVYTHARGKLHEDKGEREFVHFENHTRPYDPESGRFRGE